MKRRKFVSLAGTWAAMTAVAFRSKSEDAKSEAEWSFDLNPSSEHPRNSEGTFVSLKTGQIRFIYTQFYSGASDHSPARLMNLTSSDGGRSWTNETQPVVSNTAGANVMSASLLRLKSDRLALFYLIKNSYVECRPAVRWSDDEGQTWSEARFVSQAPGYFVLNNDRVIQLRSGRLVVPVAFHRTRGSDPNTYASWDPRAIAMWYLSDDEGKTWREAKDWWACPQRSGTGLQEPGVVELGDGRIFSWMRTDLGAQYGCYSEDQGERWSRPERTSLVSPVSPASIKRLPGSHKLVAIYNDRSGRFNFQPGKRTPLVLAVSSDSGKTWNNPLQIETDPDGWFCYTALHFTPESMLLGYCAGNVKLGGLNRLRIRNLTLDRLRD